MIQNVNTAQNNCRLYNCTQIKLVYLPAVYLNLNLLLTNTFIRLSFFIDMWILIYFNVKLRVHRSRKWIYFIPVVSDVNWCNILVHITWYNCYRTIQYSCLRIVKTCHLKFLEFPSLFYHFILLSVHSKIVLVLGEYILRRIQILFYDIQF